AWHVVTGGVGLRDDASGVVELGWVGEMRDVPGVNHEGRFCRQRFDLGDGLFERTDHIGIGRLVEPDMAVTDLQEGELARLGCQCPIDNPERKWHAARDRPQHPSTRPGHALQHFSPAHIDIVVAFHEIAHGRPPRLVGPLGGDPAKTALIPGSQKSENLDVRMSALAQKRTSFGFALLSWSGQKQPTALAANIAASRRSYRSAPVRVWA